MDECKVPCTTTLLAGERAIVDIRWEVVVQGILGMDKEGKGTGAGIWNVFGSVF